MGRGLKGRRFLLAPGLAGEVFRAMRPFGVDYMGAQADWLAAQGALVEPLRAPSSSAVLANAGLIEAALRAAPATVIAHSKGGLEALAALVRPGMIARCEGFIAFQSPFAGSPIADLLVSHAPLHRATRWLCARLGVGDGLGLHDLTTARRQAWLVENADGIAELCARVPVLAIASVLRERQAGPDRRYLPLARWLLAQGHGENDGLVTLASALLPGARHLVVEAGHRGLVASGPGRDPVGMLRRALALLDEEGDGQRAAQAPA